jgi:DNA-binding NtrC family response regulator
MAGAEISIQTVDTLITPAGVDAPSGSIPALTVVYHPDLDRVGEHAPLVDLAAGKPVRLSRDEPAFAPPGVYQPRPLDDRCISRQPAILTARKDGGIRISLRETRTKLVLGERPVADQLDLSARDLARGAVLRLGGGIVLLAHFVGAALPARDEDLGLWGESDAIHQVRREVRRVAGTDAPVLIRGETGTGKELVARAIHAASARSKGPFVAVNLGAIPPALAAAELFGAEKGSFTGAAREQPGYFDAARGGTLFLDELGEAPPEVQVMLLRAIETGETQRVGGRRAAVADARIVAATDADLEARIRDGSFRAPLLHRLAAYEIAIPPLRERRDDIPRLLLHFLREELAQAGASERLASSPDAKPWLPASLMARLVDLDWSGNVRQLRNVARRIVLTSAGHERVELDPALDRLLDPSTSAPRRSEAPVPAPASVRDERRRPADLSEAELRAALRESRWDFAAAAERLKISRASIYVLIQRIPGLRTAGDLDVEEIVRAHYECDGVVERMVERLEVSERALRRRLRELGLEAR